MVLAKPKDEANKSNDNTFHEDVHDFFHPISPFDTVTTEPEPEVVVDPPKAPKAPKEPKVGGFNAKIADNTKAGQEAKLAADAVKGIEAPTEAALSAAREGPKAKVNDTAKVRKAREEAEDAAMQAVIAQNRQNNPDYENGVWVGKGKDPDK